MSATVSNELLRQHLRNQRPIDRLRRENEARRGEHRSMGAYRRHERAFLALVVFVSVLSGLLWILALAAVV